MISISPSGQPTPAEGKGFEPSSHFSGNRFSKAARPTVSGYLPLPLPVDPPGIEPARFSNRQGQHAALASSRWTMSPCCRVDRREIEPRFPACGASVVPLDQQPVSFSGPDGGRTQHTDLARVSRHQRHAGPFVVLQEVRPGIEPDLPPYHGGVLPKHLQTSQ